MTMQFYVFAGVLYLIVNIGLERIGKSIEHRVAVR